jgi:hypothetical protein
MFIDAVGDEPKSKGGDGEDGQGPERQMFKQRLEKAHDEMQGQHRQRGIYSVESLMPLEDGGEAE